MRCFDLRAVTDGELLKKPTTVYITDEAQYTPQFSRAVVRSHMAMRKRRQTILDAFAVESCLLPGRAGDGPLKGPSEDLSVVKIDEGASAISFPSHVPKSIASALRRVHQNMGHPSNEDLARHLRLAGADTQAVKACQQLRCQTCCRSTTAGSRRPAKVVKPLDFNEEVAVDTMHLYTCKGTKVTVPPRVPSDREKRRGQCGMFPTRMDGLGGRTYNRSSRSRTGAHERLPSTVGETWNQCPIHSRASPLAKWSCRTTK